MLRYPICYFVAGAAAVVLGWSALCGAQTKPEKAEDADDAGSSLDSPDSAAERPSKAPSVPEDQDASTRHTSEKGSTIWPGVRYRAIVVPQFMVNLFGDGGRTLLLHSGGGEVALRSGLQEMNFGLWYAGYGMEPTPFKGKTQPVEAWEIAESELSILYATADFLWGIAIAPKLALNLGVGTGLGLVFGDLKRTQAYPGPNANRGTGEGFKPCQAKKLPDPTFCGADNDHYAGYTEPSWFNGGSKPVVFPWLALQTGLRYEFTPKFSGRLDLGFGTSGFFVGLGGNYGL